MLRTARNLLRCTGRHLSDVGRSPVEKAVKNRLVAFKRPCSTLTTGAVDIEGSGTPRRAVLYVPGHSEKMLNKLTDLKVDCAVMECEDGVAINKKAEARETVCRMLDSLELSLVTDVAVRINSMESGFAEDDLTTILKAQRLPDTIFFPKVDSVEHIYWLVRQLKSNLRDRDVTTPIKIIIYAESAIALLRLPEIISEALELFDSEPFSLDGVVFGSDDYCANIGATRTPDGKELLYARQKVVSVAKAFGLQAIDMVHIDVKDQDGLQKYSKEGAMMGFTGKQVIHPSQVPIVQQSFSPSPDRVEWATQLLAGFQQHQETGQGAFMFRGSMIDMPLVLQAKNIMELAKIDDPSAS
ncbi:citramalyl-CoA lyase, mitochondrial-like [Lytechinus variegatus]|uniref:citramalyl-CoA lyase, mitochondrial-like n=1 Tax=Lytechinus variegatus TaxID=7654 RepID=UPI001BB2C20F|nr:citramalyl-CoA lyase, mitochondrial-like [Lytechinus variegatus]